jgi:hypothetical protein
MSNIKTPYVTRVSVAILFFLIVAMALYFESKPQSSEVIDQYLTGAEIDDRIESIESDLIKQVKDLESKRSLGKGINIVMYMCNPCDNGRHEDCAEELSDGSECLCEAPYERHVE